MQYHDIFSNFTFRAFNRDDTTSIKIFDLFNLRPKYPSEIRNIVEFFNT